MGVAIYARLNPDDYSTWAPTTFQQKTTSRTTARLPEVNDDDDIVPTFQIANICFCEAAADMAENNANNDTEWAPCPPSRRGGGGGPGARPPTTDGDL